MAGEGRLQAHAKKECKNKGVLCYKFSSPARRGVPDLILVFPSGAVVFIELKNPNGKGRLSAMQEREKKLLEGNNAHVYVCSRPDHINKIIAHYLTEPTPARRL